MSVWDKLGLRMCANRNPTEVRSTKDSKETLRNTGQRCRHGSQLTEEQQGWLTDRSAVVLICPHVHLIPPSPVFSPVCERYSAPLNINQWNHTPSEVQLSPVVSSITTISCPLLCLHLSICLLPLPSLPTHSTKKHFRPHFFVALT